MTYVFGRVGFFMVTRFGRGLGVVSWWFLIVVGCFSGCVNVCGYDGSVGINVFVDSSVLLVAGPVFLGTWAYGEAYPFASEFFYVFVRLGVST